MRIQYSKDLMTSERYTLDETRRDIVLRSIQQTCEHSQWSLLTAHVRSNHVHVIVSASCPPERVMNALKAYSSRALNEVEARQPRWTRHGSTRHLFTSEDIEAAMRYVMEQQGSPMARV